MKRQIIEIDEERCTGCGLCIPACPEGALQIIDGKARLVSDLFCDGLGACLGNCPEGAIKVTEREAEPYDEARALENVMAAGWNTLRAHLTHLKSHGREDLYEEALHILRTRGYDTAELLNTEPSSFCCPGSSLKPAGEDSALSHWPIQMHLISPSAPQYRGADLLLAADCTAFAAADFHSRFLKDKALAVACPKLDEGQEIYVEKLKALIDEAEVRSITVVMMQVPCCNGLMRLTQIAAAQCRRAVPTTAVIIGLDGRVLREDLYA